MLLDQPKSQWMSEVWAGPENKDIKRKPVSSISEWGSNLPWKGKAFSSETMNPLKQSWTWRMTVSGFLSYWLVSPCLLKKAGKLVEVLFFKAVRDKLFVLSGNVCIYQLRGALCCLLLTSACKIMRKWNYVGHLRMGNTSLVDHSCLFTCFVIELVVRRRRGSKKTSSECVQSLLWVLPLPVLHFCVGIAAMAIL